MPKITKYPGLRTHIRKGASGQVYVYYFFDGRPEGKPDTPLGSDRAEALRQWDLLRNHQPAVRGKLQEAFDRFREKTLPGYDNPETRRNYERSLRRLEPVFGGSTWDDVTLPDLAVYLERRKAKTQGNREMSVFSVVWNLGRRWGMTKLHWPAEGVKGWKNAEFAREFDVTDELFTAVYEMGDQVLKDAMDIATATGMRLTDVRTIPLPRQDDLLHLKASKTGKAADFDLALSEVLPALLARRRGLRASHIMLLSTPSGRPVTARMLRERWDEAREAAAFRAEHRGNPGLAEQIRAMYLRDMRKRAANLADDLEGASQLLQHSSTAVTKRHYRPKGPTLKTVR